MRGKRTNVIDFDAVKRVPITAVLARLGVLDTLRKSGSRLVGVCPIHKGKHRKQFSVDQNKNAWFCFGDCNRGGNTINLVEALEGVSTRDAAGMIAEWFAIYPPARAVRGNQKRRSQMSHPSHKVFTVRDADPDDKEAKPWYTRIGSAWPIKSGKGLAIQLDALPVGDRMVLFEFDNEEEAKSDVEKQPKRGKK